MSRKISELYDKYHIMPLLREHMFRVAGVASVICDNFDGELPKEDMVTACLLHDMGNIVKSNLSYFPESLEPQGLVYWQKIKDDYVVRYGTNDHDATLKILKEIGVSERVYGLVDQVVFAFLCKHKDDDDFKNKIICYADDRVDPHGVVSYEDRMSEARKRYKLNTTAEENEREVFIACGAEIEKQIFARCKIKPEDINNEAVAPIISSLRDFVIK